jgi:hypothetical protein
LKLDEKVNKDIKVALFGTERGKDDIYDFLQKTHKLTSEASKPFVESGKVIMGYGLTQSIPDICHFGKNIILLKKIYYNNILLNRNLKKSRDLSKKIMTVTISTSSSSKKLISRARQRLMMMSRVDPRVGPRVGRRSRERFSIMV